MSRIISNLTNLTCGDQAMPHQSLPLDNTTQFLFVYLQKLAELRVGANFFFWILKADKPNNWEQLWPHILQMIKYMGWRTISIASVKVDLWYDIHYVRDEPEQPVHKVDSSRLLGVCSVSWLSSLNYTCVLPLQLTRYVKNHQSTRGKELVRWSPVL